MRALSFIKECLSIWLNLLVNIHYAPIPDSGETLVMSTSLRPHRARTSPHHIYPAHVLASAKAHQQLEEDLKAARSSEMPPKGQRDTERSVTLTPQADATTLRLDLFTSLSKWPTLEQALVKLFFRVGARMDELILIHQATWVANAHAPPQQNAPPVHQ